MHLSVFIVSDPRLLSPLLPVIIRAVLVSLGVVAAMFFFTYLPQVAVLAFVSGPLGECSGLVPCGIIIDHTRPGSLHRCRTTRAR